MDKKLTALLRMWNQLTDKHKDELLAHMRQLIINQDIQRNRSA